MQPFEDAIKDFHRCLRGQKIDHVNELSYYDKKRIHNLKYFTWIEQREFELDELNRQWHDNEAYWSQIQSLIREIDDRIINFNSQVAISNA